MDTTDRTNELELRDRLAAAAMGSILRGRNAFDVISDLHSPTTGFGEMIVVEAYRLADMMVAQRKQPPAK